MKTHKPGEVPLHHLSELQAPYVLSKWYLHVGDAIFAPQVIARIETASSILDLEAFDCGVLAEQCFSVGDVIPNGAVVARIEPLV